MFFTFRRWYCRYLGHFLHQTNDLFSNHFSYNLPQNELSFYQTIAPPLPVHAREKKQAGNSEKTIFFNIRDGKENTERMHWTERAILHLITALLRSIRTDLTVSVQKRSLQDRKLTLQSQSETFQDRG